MADRVGKEKRDRYRKGSRRFMTPETFHLSRAIHYDTFRNIEAQP